MCVEERKANKLMNTNLYKQFNQFKQFKRKTFFIAQKITLFDFIVYKLYPIS